MTKNIYMATFIAYAVLLLVPVFTDLGERKPAYTVGLDHLWVGLMIISIPFILGILFGKSSE